MSAKEHSYALELEWRGDHTRTYESYTREHVMRIAGKPDLNGTADPIFRAASSLGSASTSGLVSVMPKPCWRGTPLSIHALISSRGVGEPPTPAQTSEGNAAGPKAGD